MRNLIDMDRDDFEALCSDFVQFVCSRRPRDNPRGDFIKDTRDLVAVSRRTASQIAYAMNAQPALRRALWDEFFKRSGQEPVMQLVMNDDDDLDQEEDPIDDNSDRCGSASTCSCSTSSTP